MKSWSLYGELKKFVGQNRLSCLVVAGTVLLAYSFMFFYFGYSIDTEEIIVKQMDFYKGWLSINRYGLIFTKWLFGVLSIVPGYAQVLMLLTTVVYCIVWMYFFHMLREKSDDEVSPWSWVFPAFFVTSIPVLELVNFQCHSFEIAFAMLVGGFSLI